MMYFSSCRKIILISILAGWWISCKSLNKSSSDISAIIDSDDRTILTDPTALKMIGTIVRRGTPICTAFAIGKSQIATASHCIDYARDNLSLYAFRRPDATVIKISSIARRKHEPDIIILNVEFEFSNSLAIGHLSNDDRVEIWSYDPRREKFFSQADCSAAYLPHSKAFRHSCDTVGGSSGSPVLKDGNLVGIHLGFIKSANINIAMSASQLSNDEMDGLETSYLSEFKASSLKAIATFPTTVIATVAINPVAKGTYKAGTKEIEEATSRVVERQLLPLVNQIDFAATKLIGKVNTDILGGTVTDVERELGNEIRTSSAAMGEVIRKIVAESMIETRTTIGGIDRTLENRIKQVGIIVAKMSDQIIAVANDFSPERLQNNLVSPALSEIGALEAQVHADIDSILNRVDCSVLTVKEEITKEIKSFTDFLPHPFDKCRNLNGDYQQEYIQEYFYSKCKIFGNISSTGEIIKGEITESTELSRVLIAYARMNSLIPKMRCLEKDNSLFLQLIDKDYSSFISSFNYWKNLEDI